VVTNVQRRKGMLGMRADAYSLIVTPIRLVLAPVTQQMMRDAIATARQEAIQEGRGMLGQVAAQMGWMDVIRRQYANASIEGIFRGLPGCIVFWNAEIRRVRLRQVGDDERGFKEELVIEANSGKHRFDLQGAEAGTARRLLRQTLGSVVK
jgi:hypothetical protein